MVRREFVGTARRRPYRAALVAGERPPGRHPARIRAGSRSRSARRPCQFRMALRLGLAGARGSLVLLPCLGLYRSGSPFSLNPWAGGPDSRRQCWSSGAVSSTTSSGRWRSHATTTTDTLTRTRTAPAPAREEPRLERRGFFDLQGTFRYLHSRALTPPQGAGIAAHCAVQGVSEIHEHGHEHGQAILSLGRSVGMGMLHGLAGSGLLVAVAWSAAPSALHRWMTICLYGAGAMGAMGAMTYAVGRTLRAVPPPVERLLRIASGVASVIVGMTLLT
jgi:hypothetical protein